LESQLAENQQALPTYIDRASAIENALKAADGLVGLTDSERGIAAARELFDAASAELFLALKKVRLKKRVLTRLSMMQSSSATQSDRSKNSNGPTSRRQFEGKQYQRVRQTR